MSDERQSKGRKRSTVELNARVSPQLRDDLDVLAIAMDCSRNDLVRRILVGYVNETLHNQLPTRQRRQRQ